jgi:hypothetical protein
MPLASTSPGVVGGSYSTGPAHGQYHCVVNDAAITESRTGRPMATLKLVVKDDPNHQSKESKGLGRDIRQSLPMDSDDPEKVGVMKGMVKRMLYDGFDMPWPDEAMPLDKFKAEIRKWVGKQCWVNIGDTKQADGTMGPGVTDVAITQEKLPVRAARKNGTPAPASPAGGRKARRG